MARSRAQRHGERRRPARTTVRGLAFALALLGAAVGGCAGGKRSHAPYQEQLESNAAALERLAFGMTRAEATAVMGEQSIHPPWANDRGIGPQVLRNPFDSGSFESPDGEAYEVDRYAVGLYGQSGCPFIRGEARLVPLIYLEGELVGWRWSYLESALQRTLEPEEEGWSFGEFCGQGSGAPD